MKLSKRMTKTLIPPTYPLKWQQVIAGWRDEVAQLEEGVSATRIELGMALTERAAVIMKYEQLEAENAGLWRYVDHDWGIDDSDAFICNFLVGHPGEGKFVCKCGLDALRTQEPA